mmetsp:Transcript_19979/g.36141  ORF Transcript_19979/g.36141 Transcript_19979/m.36141 type:complete len:726 (+) Transcript_19979:211-2388(+)|eukprot:CAMPEP_0201871132 /NCGR_PEP_ID=MMETSP0902-20130614/4116_1 /ASSEMBLY_ACC=CAM_ASM_000551 /TAXON_ID=420261 /ORGANISM="Thalassiosira antarctica, Strain CCMP982" /LENGTH=725 /DNA_ID=CAMNT_0048397035 /DNA_START=103 /DNA_END=2280 /DNA_ORIENTATION=+
MLAFVVGIVTAAMMVNANVNAATTASSSPDIQQQQYRILTNAETGTIIHPLIPHKSHLDRRRRELFSKYGAELDTTLPPRPHTSRHSQTPNNAAVISALRANQKHNDNRDLQQQMGALYQGYGTHYIDLWVGSPTPQRQTVIVDTGSGVTAFPCEECKGCGDKYHTDNYFKESQSESFRSLGCNECFRGYCASIGGSKKCRISMSYAEGSSWSAYEAMDLCYAGGPHDVALSVSGAMTNTEDIVVDHIDPVEAAEFAFELAFGCQISITGLFITQLADGIMGMENEKTSFWKQMHLKNAIPRPEFSLCFSRSNEAERDGTGAGAMTLGGVDPRLHMSPMVFAKNVKSSGFYAVNLKAVYLRDGGGVSAQTTQGDMPRMHNLGLSESQLNRGNVIVDSGTTDTYFSSTMAGPFKKAWKELTGKDYNHNPVSMTAEQIDALPTIVLVLSGFDGQAVGDEPIGEPNDVAGYVGDTDLSSNPRDVILAIPAAHYMEYDPENKKYVPRFYTEESSGSVLGANAMMGHDFYFDIARGRIGFAESNCDYVSLLLSEGTSISMPPQTVSTKTEVPETTVAPPEVPETAVAPPQEEEEEEAVENYDNGGDGGETESIEPGPDQSENTETPYEIFGNDKPTQGKKSGGGGLSGLAEEILDDMKHECSSTGCRGVAFLFIFGALAVVIAGIRKAMARRRVVRQYQEAELEISDLALDSDSDDEGGYVDEPPLHQIT